MKTPVRSRPFRAARARSRRPRWIVVIVVLVLFLATGLGGWWWWRHAPLAFPGVLLAALPFGTSLLFRHRMLVLELLLEVTLALVRVLKH